MFFNMMQCLCKAVKGKIVWKILKVRFGMNRNSEGVLLVENDASLIKALLLYSEEYINYVVPGKKSILSKLYFFTTIKIKEDNLLSDKENIKICVISNGAIKDLVAMHKVWPSFIFFSWTIPEKNNIELYLDNAQLTIEQIVKHGIYGMR